MSTKHIEFPHLTREANAALEVALAAHRRCKQCTFEAAIRESCAAFLREAMKQVQGVYDIRPLSIVWWEQLQAVANNLHDPPPPPPTLAQAQAADLDTPEGKAAVRAFLAALGEGLP
jgi:hypothetical protein